MQNFGTLKSVVLIGCGAIARAVIPILIKNFPSDVEMLAIDAEAPDADALTDINAGEMLTNDYAFFGGIDIDFRCECRSAGCRGTCGSPPSPEHIRRLSLTMLHAMQRIDLVAQPLSTLISTDCMEDAREQILLLAKMHRAPIGDK